MKSILEHVGVCMCTHAKDNVSMCTKRWVDYSVDDALVHEKLVKNGTKLAPSNTHWLQQMLLE